MSEISLLLLYLLTLISVAFLTLLERKILGIIQNRKGPSKVGVYGVLQPFADAIKLFAKSTNSTILSLKIMYFFMPIFFLTLSLIFFLFKFISTGLIYCYSVFIILFFYSLSVYSSLISGWISNSKYSLIGGMRSIIQSISYEISISLVIFFFSFLYSTLSFNQMFLYMSQYNNLCFNFLLIIVLLISVMIECNRSPFDLSEGESELVSGFNVEYGGMEFSLIFLGENVMMIFNSFLVSFFSFKSNILSWGTMVFLTIILLSRGSFPRFRFDVMMTLCWLILVPISLVIILAMFFFI